MSHFIRSTAVRAAGTVLAAALLVSTLGAPAALAGTPPTVSSFSPTSGPVGTGVIISGMHFTGATKVKFRDTLASFSVNNDSQISTTVPTGATTGRIRVVTPDGAGESSDPFVVTSGGAPPVISSFNPTSGPVGTSVTINGSNFTGVTQVAFGGVSASFTFNSDTKITAIVPHGANTGRIRVTTPAGTGSSSTNFKVTSGTAPVINSFSPTSGPVGTSVTINGSNFTGVTKVTFNGVSASFTFNSDTKITAIVPHGANTGRIRVTTPAGTGSSSTNFKVTGAAPMITSFSPSSGRVGTTVVIIGMNFTGATQVRFNGRASSFVVNSPTQITATVLSSASTGFIKVTTSGGTATSNAPFHVVHPRMVSLHLHGGLVAAGAVAVTDGFAVCKRNVPVRIQRRVRRHWRTVARRVTAFDGSYRARIRDRPGFYRAKAVKIMKSDGDICGRALSGRHRHRRH